MNDEVYQYRLPKRLNSVDLAASILLTIIIIKLVVHGVRINPWVGRTTVN